MIALDPEVEKELRELTAQPSPAPIDRQLAQYPWTPAPIDTQPTRVVRPPPMPPDAIAEAPAEHGAAVAIERGIEAIQQVKELRATLGRLVRDIRALKDHLLLLEPYAEMAPKPKALISVSLQTCDLALAAAGER